MTVSKKMLVAGLGIVLALQSLAAAASTRTLLNVWHIPQNQEPPTVTMRNPLHPDNDTDVIYIYCGAYPQHSIWSGICKFRVGTGSWQPATFSFDSNQNPNEYWMASFNNDFPPGSTVQYYLELHGDPATYATTFIYGDDSHSNTTATEATAQASPYSYTLPQVSPTATPTTSGTLTPTPTVTLTPTINPSVTFTATPTITDTPTPFISPTLTISPTTNPSLTVTPTSTNTRTPTPSVPPQPTMHVWHIPQNTEPPSVTMRNPLHPDAAATAVFIYCGGYPQGAIWATSTLYFNFNNGAEWSSAAFAWDSNQGSNEYFVAVINQAFHGGDVVRYYLAMMGNPVSFATTYVYGTDNSTNSTTDENLARDNAYMFTIPVVSPTATPTGAPHSPTATPTGPTRTPTPSAATHTVTATPTGGSRTPTVPPTRTSTPIATASPTITPTLLPEGVTLEMPAHQFAEGDECWLKVTIGNPDSEITSAALFVVLDVNIGVYWFWPNWRQYPPNDLDYQTMDVPVGETTINVIGSFEWPAGTGDGSGFFFISALLSGDLTTVFGQTDSWEFGYN